MASTGLIAAVACIGLSSCGGDDPVDGASERSATAERPPDPTATGIHCPKELRISNRPECKLIDRRAKLTPCPNTRIGHDLRVSAVRCGEAYGLMAPLELPPSTRSATTRSRAWSFTGRP